MTYTSPYTGKTYDVVEVNRSRTDYIEQEGQIMPSTRKYVEYQFHFGGRMVTWTYDIKEKTLSDTFAEVEHVFPARNCSPWD